MAINLLIGAYLCICKFIFYFFFAKNMQLNQQQPNVSQMRDRNLCGSEVNLFLTVRPNLDLQDL